jgi:sugar phosphate isomerase/epimerase
MQLGLLTAAFPTLSLDEIADWAAANGFETLEVACWPAGEGAARRYAGVCHIDVEALEEARAGEIVAGLERRGLRISALAYYPNVLSHDAEAAAAANEHLKAVIAAAPLLGVDIVGTFAGRNRHRNLPDNLDAFRKVWPPLVAHAAEHGVRIAIENCPMIFSYDEWPGGDNLAYAPAVWREMFTAIPDDNFGLNFDPSHLIWQMIDVERAVHEFAERIFHVHGKDLEVRPDGLYEHGVMSAGIGWQVPRLCGLGQVDWGRFVGALYAVGYDNVVSVEHEDRRFEGSVELVQRGFLIARNTLRPLLA